jgi:hypothetical protein
MEVAVVPGRSEGAEWPTGSVRLDAEISSAPHEDHPARPLEQIQMTIGTTDGERVWAFRPFRPRLP